MVCKLRIIVRNRLVDGQEGRYCQRLQGEERDSYEKQVRW